LTLLPQVYGFEGEAKHKHGDLTYKLFAYVFTALPLASLVSPALPPSPKTLASSVSGGKAPILSSEGRLRFFVTHGGLFSKDNVTLDDIRAIPRLGKQPGNEGLMCELLWTDPQEAPGRGPSKRGKLSNRRNVDFGTE
jgi:serine/threonine-protein phosphatase 5